MQSVLTTEKIYNEIELCEISDPECKDLIEKELLKNRISYYVRWLKPRLFKRSRNDCIICVHENAKEQASEVVKAICDEKGYSVKFLMRKAEHNFL